MKTADLKFLDLCDEIDYWRQRAKTLESDVNYWKNEYQELLNGNLKSAQQGVANALLFCLSVKDGEDGSLVIDKKSREQLAERYKTDV